MSFSVDGVERRVSGDTEVAAFRIAQEALRNIEKHAGASRVSVELRFEDEWMRLRIDDDGAGIETAAAGGNGSGLGIEGMRERAEIHGGSFRILPRSGRGTRVEVLLPG